MNRLTAPSINAATAGLHGDGNGLYLKVEATGAKRWILRTVVQGKRRDIGLGSVLTTKLKNVREDAARLRGLARKGEDVIAARRSERRVVPTFEAAALTVHKQHSAEFRNPKHRAQWLASMKAHVFPTFGARPVNTIDTVLVLKVLEPLWTKKRETARRLRQRIRVVLDWAKASGFRSGDNPVDGVAEVLPRGRKTVEHHAALPYGLVPAFVEALRVAPAGESVRLAFEFTILTAARTNETIGARWQEIDHAAKVWTVPAERVKSNRAHAVPLTPRALEILDAAAKLGDGKPASFIFPGRAATRALSSMAFLMTLRRMKRKEITAHGFRSSFRDWAAEKTNAPRAVAEAALGHVVKDETEAAYLRTTLFERRRRLMASWTQFATAKPASVAVIG